MANDFAPFKPKTDVIVVADAHARGGAPVSALETGIGVGSLVKRLAVLGDHEWIDGRLNERRPFAAMPITCARAYGGPDDPGNPVGKGQEMFRDQRGRRVSPMPNVVHPGRAVASPGAGRPAVPLRRRRWKGSGSRRWARM